jgi:hypothetical protein
MSLTDAELFDIVEPRHPCAGMGTLSLEDMQLRMAQKMQDLKIDEKMVASKEVLSRTWVQGSSKVRAGLGSAWANLDQYRQAQRKPSQPSQPSQPGQPGQATETQIKTEGEGEGGGETNGTGRKETFVGGGAAWAAEKRKRAFQKEEPARVERVDIGPAPARPLAMWAAQRKRSSESGEGKGGGEGSSVRSSVTGETMRTSSDTQVETVEKEKEGEK